MQQICDTIGIFLVVVIVTVIIIFIVLYWF